MGSIPRCLSLMMWVAMLGCASWDQPEQTSPSLPGPRISRDTIVLEIELARFGEDRPEEYDELWRSVDEQQLPPELRRRLAANGLRCGVIESHLPISLREALAGKMPAIEQLAVGRTPSEDRSFENYRQLTCRAGKHYRVAATPQTDRRVVVFSEEGRLRAEQFTQAQGLFGLVTTPLGDGRARLQLTPLVEHGEVQRRLVPGEAGFIVDPRRAESSLELIGFESVLAPGATLLVSSSAEAKGLGGWYFGDEAERGLLLIRLVGTQFDDLFSDQPPRESLTTPLDQRSN